MNEGVIVATVTPSSIVRFEHRVLSPRSTAWCIRDQAGIWRCCVRDHTRRESVIKPASG